MKSLLAFAFCLLCCCSATFVSAEDGLSSRISAIIDNLSNFGWKSQDRMHADDCHCENGRCVKDSRGRWKCLCKPKYALQEDFECKECDCGNNGNCIFNKNFNPNTNEWQFDKKCVCNKGYAEKNGQCIACLCGENSKCEFEGDEKICYCEEGFAENDGKCTACDCGEGGICEFHDGKKVCSCFDDFAFDGKTCQACNCGDKSKGCNFESGTKKCDCPTGHTERNGQCEEWCTTDEGCGHGGTCVPHGEGKKCVCMPGLSGDNCEHIDECISGKFSKCKGAKGTCIYSKEEQKAYCKCDERMMFNDTSNICVDCKCGNYGIGCYVKDDIKTCICYKGFTEKYGKCEETCVTDDGCGYGGTCVRDGDIKKCVCMPGLSGDYCQHIDECSDTGKFKRCRGINGKCTYSKEEKKAFCECKGAMWFDRSLDICVDGCLKNVCHNGGKCKVAEEEILCDCGKGLSGEFCEVVNDCVNGTFKNCRGDQGSCTYSQQKQGAVCECAGKKKLDSTSNTCKACDCGEGGICEFRDGKKVCSCFDDFAFDGQLCQACNCGDKSKGCNFESGTKKCNCPTGYKDRNGQCEELCTTDEGCGHGGTCVPHGEGKKCVCMPGLSGDNCEHIDECISGKFSECKGAKGTCTYSKEEQKAYCKCDERMMFNDTSNICVDCNCGNYGKGCYVKDDIKTCICYKGFTEIYGKCEELCSTDAGCGYGGTCVPHGEGKKCVCMPGLSGDHCQNIDECSDTGKFKRCRGINGKCTYSKEEKKAFCECTGAMWFDRSLDICVDGCLKNVCHNGGKCKVAEEEILCDCGKGLSGEFCEVVNDCVNGKFKNCKGEQGSCTYSQQKQEAVCECAGKKKLDSTSNTCKECDCGPHSLDCGFENQQKRCKCLEKYIEEDGICQSIACTKANCNGGTCRITGDKAECICPSFQVLENGKCVYDCENYVDEDIDECEVCDD